MMSDNQIMRTQSILPDNLHFIFIGIMLGDGAIYRTSKTSNSRFEMSFGQDCKQFAESIGFLFTDYIDTPVKYLEIKGKNKNYINYRLKTVSLPLFNKYHELFYKFNQDKNKYIKTVPHDIFDYMNSTVLAYLIMTDGNFDKSRNRVRIYTNSYTKEEVILLANSIKSKLGIYTGVLYDRKDQ